MKELLKYDKSLEVSSLLPEGVSETIQNEPKEQRGGFSLYVIRYTRCKFTRKYFSQKRINRAGEVHSQGIVCAGYGFNPRLKSHPLTNIEIQKYYQNEPRFNRVYSRDNLPKIKYGAYIINLDE